MGELKFTRDDRRFLRSLRIDPGEDQDVLDVYKEATPGGFPPNALMISNSLAQRIAARFGAVNTHTYMLFIREQRYGKGTGD